MVPVALALSSMVVGVLAAAYAPRGALRLAVRLVFCGQFVALVAYVASGAMDCGISCTATHDRLSGAALIVGPVILLALTAVVAVVAYRRALRRARG